jgi:hypothetical protein
MHAERMGGIVLEDDVERVTDFSVEDQSEEAEMLIFRAARLWRGEAGVGVLAINGLPGDSADLVRAWFDSTFDL